MDSGKDTSGLSVASRIRMYQSNFDGSSNTQPLVKKNSSDSPKLLVKSTQCSKEEAKNGTITQTISKKCGAEDRILTPNKEKNLDLTIGKRLNSPLSSPRPSPTTAHKAFPGKNCKADLKNKTSNEQNHSRDLSKQLSDKESLPKPPLPSKPIPKLSGETSVKDVNDNCGGKPAPPKKDFQFAKSPLAAKVSSEKLSEYNRKNSDGNVNWKRVSGPPSRPLPPGPKPSSVLSSKTENVESTKTECNPAVTRRNDGYEDVDIVYEDPDSHPAIDTEDNEYEDPSNDGGFVDSQALAKKDRKILSRISTSRRPPPLPILNQEGQKKTVKPPPLPSRNSVATAEDQSFYSYAADVTPVFQTPITDATYETPDASTVRGLMLGLQNQSGNYETPDSESVKEFLSKVNEVDSTGDDTYETPDQDTVDAFTNALKKKQVEDSDSDSDAYCDPDGLPPSFHQRKNPQIPLAPQKSLPPPPPGEERNEPDSSDDDSGHDYEDPSEEFRPAARILSLRRGSQPVFNPDAYLALVDIENDTSYQDPAEAFASVKGPIDEENEDDAVYEDLVNEPLYQVYAADVLSEMRRQSQKGYKEEDDIFNEYSTGSIEAGQRLLWCQLPSVRNSGVLENLEPRERKRQEAMFEVITSEASYLKSLSILINHFMNSFFNGVNMPAEERLVDKQQFHFLFGGLSVIKNTSEKFLHSLRGKQEENFIISSISDVVSDYATNHFECYVKYCSNQVYQERTLSSLLSDSQAFCDALGKLETSTGSQGLPLQSFLMLPMQRITRMPLLIDAICRQCEPGSDEFHKTDKALSAVHKVVKACNEGARKMERIEEMYFIQQMLTFKMKPIPIVSSSRWLLRRGELACLEGEKKIRAFKSLLRGGKYYRIYLFLFNDLLLVTKMKGEDSFKVVDYCSRAMLRIDDAYVPTGDTLKPGNTGIPTNKYMFTLILLENHQGKTMSYICLAETETEKIRWVEAINPKPAGQEGEKIYEEWDCPQVRAIHAYQSVQPDEINLREGDVIKVLRKLPDGWYEGTNMIDSEQGWFPANHTEEIHSEHTKARNLMQRYRLINTVTMAFDTRTKGI